MDKDMYIDKWMTLLNNEEVCKKDKGQMKSIYSLKC